MDLDASLLQEADLKKNRCSVKLFTAPSLLIGLCCILLWNQVPYPPTINMAALWLSMQRLTAHSIPMQPMQSMVSMTSRGAAAGLPQAALSGSAPIALQIFASARQISCGRSIACSATSQVSGDAIKEEQLKKMTYSEGFISALDESGGTSPKTLKERADLLGRMLDDSSSQGSKPLVGVTEKEFMSHNELMSKSHELRVKLITNPSYTGDKILGAILLEDTIHRNVEGIPTAQYLWDKKKVVPFLKTDVGLAPAANGVQMMKDNPGLEAMLDRGLAKGIWGTKQRSQIQAANATGIKALVEQHFEFAQRTIAKGMVPILQPEVDINAPDKAEIEELLLSWLMAGLAKLSPEHKVIFKLTLPETANLYLPLMEYPQVVRMVASSGSYNLDESLKKLSENTGMIASLDLAQLTGR